MKKIQIVIAVLLISIPYCNSQSNSRFFYDESNYNTTKEIKSFDNKLFVLGQHFLKKDSVQHVTSILCTDTALNKIWDKHLGNYDADERFESFSLDPDGNLFLSGYNGKQKSALLSKLSTTGELQWKKEFNNITSFNNLEIYNNNSLIIAGTKSFPNSAVTTDSTVISKTDFNGNILWTKTICPDIGLRFLKLLGDKIILCVNTTNSPVSFPISKLFCLNQNGEIEWSYDLDLKNTAIDFGVKSIKLKIVDDQNILVLCQSHNSRNPILVLQKFDQSGKKISSYKVEHTELTKTENLNDKVVLLTGLSYFVYGKKPLQIILKEDEKKEPYFCLTETVDHLIDFVTINNERYLIANKLDLEKHFSKWQISKF
ncbi:hypothetical protein [Flavobacterium sp. HJSW_4]|uniref:hypothetical protein n=1 Tax=Flavobacterium sp. HJSW_4 TaxID=3344660 RepID=UPI0035F3FC7C